MPLDCLAIHSTPWDCWDLVSVPSVKASHLRTVNLYQPMLHSSDDCLNSKEIHNQTLILMLSFQFRIVKKMVYDL